MYISRAIFGQKKGLIDALLRLTIFHSPKIRISFQTLVKNQLHPTPRKDWRVVWVVINRENGKEKKPSVRESPMC
jgi:hypothetical protein